MAEGRPWWHLEGYARDYLMFLQPKYAEELMLPPDPEQQFLLGSKWADYGLAVVFALAFPVLRSILRRFVYEPWGRYALIGDSKKRVKAVAKAERFRKWNESCWKMTVFLIFTIMALVVSSNEPWFWDTRYFWLGCYQFPPCNLEVSRGVLLFYCVETGFYLQAIHFLIFHEVRRKDWLESMIHHIATVILLAYSYWVNFTRIGVMVLLLHDVGDIFLEAAKLARYARKQSLAVVIFAIFTTVWIVTRNFLYPAVIIRSTLTESIHFADIHGVKVEPHFTIFNSLLILLEILHIYWTYLILKIVVRQLTIGDARDIREEESDDD